MMWFLAEDNGNIISLECDRQPSWFAISGFGDWRTSQSEAIYSTRSKLRQNILDHVNRKQEAERELSVFEGRTAGLLATDRTS